MFHTLKMKESDSVRKHISNFCACLQQLSAVGSQVPDGEPLLPWWEVCLLHTVLSSAQWEDNPI